MGELPNSWYKSLVVPLYKSKSKCDPGNYRPVCLTSVCCKTMKRITAELFTYLEANNLLSSREFGFHNGWSVEDPLLLVYSKVAAHVDSSKLLIWFSLIFLRLLMWYHMCCCSRS